MNRGRLLLELKGGFHGSGQLHATTLIIQFRCLLKTIGRVQISCCGKFAFENLAVSRENVTIEVRFLIRIHFICSDSMHKVHFRFRINRGIRLT